MALQHLTLWRAACLAICTAVLTLSSPVAATQEPTQGSSEGVIYQGIMTPSHFDVSPPLTLIPELPPARQRERIEEIDVRGGIPGPEDVDTHVQQEVDLAGEIPAVSVGFNAFDNTSATVGPTPPDPVGDVGPNHYVAMANSRYAVYNKAGGLVFGPININTLWAGFGGPCQTENAGDPIVTHDQLADRWILMQFTAAGPNFFLCVAISQTANPAGAFYRYAISTGTRFPDYPKVGMWPNAYIFTTREFTGSTFSGVGVYGMNRAQALAGNPATQIVGFLATPGATPYRVGDGLLPADLDGFRLPPSTNPAFLVGLQDNGGGYGAPIDAINIWQLNLNFGGVSSLALTSTIATAAFDSVLDLCGGTRNCIPQPGTAQRVDHQGYRQRLLHRAAYRNHGTHQSIVSNSSVEAAVNMSGVRWYEVRNPQGGGAAVVFQQGTYAPGTTDGIHRWFGSIAQDQNGNMGLGYSASSAAVFPGIRYTGRLETDALNTMPQGEGTFQAGGGSQTGSARWGDYTSMNVDPVDDCTLWYINQYNPVTSATGWRLRVGSFEFPSCAPRATVVSLWPVGTLTPGQTARFWALVRNDGTTAMTSESRVWFYSNVANTWVGSVAITGLLPGASQWYFFDYVIPSTATAGTKSYWAQVWKNSTYPQSAFTGPQTFTVVTRTARIEQLWPVTGAIPGGSARLWALVRNIDTVAQPADARVYFWTSTSGDVGFASIAGLPAGQAAWYSFLWPVPASVNPGNYTYWAQARRGAAIISDWFGPQTFPIGFNYQFTANIAGWTAQRGTWSHASGAYLFTSGLANNTSSVSRPANLRYLDYQVPTWRNGCNSCANRIMVRGTPAPLSANGQWDSSFFFQYTRDGMFSVWKTVGGVTTAIQNWTNTPAVVRGSAWNVLRVVSYEDTFLFYINGVLVWAGTDAALPGAGNVGIGEFNDGSAGNAFWVDYALGIPTGTTTESAEAAAGPPPTDRVSDAQQRRNDEANRRPSGNVDRSR
jgi:hypothetical protein